MNLIVHLHYVILVNVTQTLTVPACPSSGDNIGKYAKHDDEEDYDNERIEQCSILLCTKKDIL